MQNERKIDISFSARAEDYIRRFMDAVKATGPEAADYIATVDWGQCVFTARDTGETIHLGPHFGVGATGPKSLTDEPIAHLSDGLAVALRLPEDLKSVDRLSFDFVDGYFVLPDQPGYQSLPQPYDPHWGRKLGA
ncbi:MAG: hypothetical protein ACLPID_07640 [Beijerinckiaceae bacterium]